MNDSVSRELAANWLSPIARHLNELRYSFKYHFGRTYDGSFGEIVTNAHDDRRVRVIWIDLTSSPGNAWMKLYFSTEDEQQHATASLVSGGDRRIRVRPSPRGNRPATSPAPGGSI